MELLFFGEVLHIPGKFIMEILKVAAHKISPTLRIHCFNPLPMNDGNNGIPLDDQASFTNKKVLKKKKKDENNKKKIVPNTDATKN